MTPQIGLACALAFVICSGPEAHGQTPIPSVPYPTGTRAYVYTVSGLTLRDTPDAKGSPIQVIPYGKSVEIRADQVAAVSFTTGNISGHWTKVNFENKIGYAFDGYLSRMSAIGDKILIEDYLKKTFPVQETSTALPDSSVVQYEITKLKNGITIEFKMYEGGVTRTIKVPQSVMLLKEVYLLCRIANPEYFSGKGNCGYKADQIRCENEETMSVLIIEKKGEQAIITESIAD